MNKTTEGYDKSLFDLNCRLLPPRQSEKSLIKNC